MQDCGFRFQESTCVKPPWGLLLIWTPRQMVSTFFNYAQAGERGPRKGQNSELGNLGKKG